jgi:hypothetical protein
LTVAGRGGVERGARRLDEDVARLEVERVFSGEVERFRVSEGRVRGELLEVAVGGGASEVVRKRVGRVERVIAAGKRSVDLDVARTEVGLKLGGGGGTLEGRTGREVRACRRSDARAARALETRRRGSETERTLTKREGRRDVLLLKAPVFDTSSDVGTFADGPRAGEVWRMVVRRESLELFVVERTERRPLKLKDLVGDGVLGAVRDEVALVVEVRGVDGAMLNEGGRR